MTTPTIVKVATRQIVLVRDGERYSPRIGKADKFTKDEIEAIKKADPEALREVNDEGLSDLSTDGDGTDTGTDDTGGADNKPAPKTKPKAGASKTDDEGL